MTSITIRDFDNISKLIDSFYQLNPTITWEIIFCRDPLILTLNTLPDKFKPEILQLIDKAKDKKYITGLDILVGAVKISKFNNTLFNQMKHFLQEFSERKNIKLPVDLTDV